MRADALKGIINRIKGNKNFPGEGEDPLERPSSLPGRLHIDEYDDEMDPDSHNRR